MNRSNTTVGYRYGRLAKHADLTGTGTGTEGVQILRDMSGVGNPRVYAPDIHKSLIFRNHAQTHYGTCVQSGSDVILVH